LVGVIAEGDGSTEKRGDRGFGDFEILRDGPAGHADRADHGAVGREQREAAGEGEKAAIAGLEIVRRGAGLAIFPDGFAGDGEQGCGTRALPMARSIDPSTAPSIRPKALRCAPASSTAIFTGTPICAARLSAAAIIRPA
jgi:hypothetical protein